MNNNPQTQQSNKTESDIKSNDEIVNDQPTSGSNQEKLSEEKKHWTDIQDFLVNLS